MAITRGATRELVLANGRVEFNRFPVINGVEMKKMALGFRYLGTSTGMNLTQENEMLEHKNSECGFNTTDEEIIISSKLTGTMTVDNISTANLALFFAGDVDNQAQVAATGKTEILKVYPEMGYKLGVTKDNPNGVFSVDVTKIETFATEADAVAGTPVKETLAVDVDYEINPEMAYLMIGDKESSKKIDKDGTYVKVTYDLKEAVREVVITKNQSIVGQLMFRGCNAKGQNRQYFLPKVRLSANGDFALKGGEEWSTMEFNITALQEEGLPMLFINGQPVVKI